MPALELTVAQEGRPRVGLPTMRTLNSYAEVSEGGPTRVARLPRPGLTRKYTLGEGDDDAGPISRQYQNPGLFNGDLFSIAGGSLYRNTTKLGTIPYSIQPRMTANLTQLAIVSGGALYVYDGASLALVPFFDDGSSRLPPFSSVAVLFNIFVYTVSGSNQFFWSRTGDATQINALSFASAETSPDPILEVVTLSDELYFCGSRTIEPWDFTGDLNLPFALAQGRTYPRGTVAQGSVVTKLDNAMFWIGDDLSVYRSSAVPQKISTPFIDDILRQSKDTLDQLYAFTAGVEGHRWYVFNLPGIGQSYAYDCQTKEWAQWGSQIPFQAEPTTFFGQCSAGEGTEVFIGSRLEPVVWLLDPDNHTDDDANMRVIISGAIWTTAGKQRLNSVGLQCVRGVGNEDAPDPVVQMRMSKDGGRTFGSWLNANLGRVGQYTVKAVWRGLGMISQPGVEFDFCVNEAVTFVAEGAAYNEARY